MATVGINIFTIKFNPPTSKELETMKGTPKKVIQIQEIGGTMAPMWKNYLNNVDKIVYVVDTSNLTQISAAGMKIYVVD